MNVLQDPHLTIRSTDQDQRASLAKVIGRLLAGPEIESFPRLGAEQRGYWWRFLVRSGTRALRTAELTVEEASSLDLLDLEKRITDALLLHTEIEDWALFQADPSRAGFCQPPTPNGKSPKSDGYKAKTCGLLTAVIGTKEHERKSKVGRVLDWEAAVYALVEYQSGVIFGGRGNYESQFTGSRSGAGSGTPFIGAWIGRSHGLTFRHDVEVMLARWEEVQKELGGSVWALWAERWDGETSLPAVQLDPAFIPLARMVRLEEPRQGQFASVWFRSSKGSRVADHTNGGNLGDIFTPLIPDPKGKHLKVRGTLGKGYDYKEVVRLLFPESAEDAVRSPSVDFAFQNPPAANDLRVILEGMAFEQGKTRGFHRRVVRLPRRAVKASLLGLRTEPLHAAHAAMLEATVKAKRVLRAALAIVLTGAPRATEDDGKKMAAAMDHVEEIVDCEYLDFLFNAVLADSENSDRTEPYRRWLFDHITRDVFSEALEALPRSQSRRFEEEVVAEAYLIARLRRELSLAKSQYPNEEVA